MQSIWILESESNDIEINNVTTERDEIVNDYEEKLYTQLFVNENIGDYVRCNIVLDEIKQIQARALGENLNSIIVRNRYEAFYRKSDGNLIVYANKEATAIIKDVFDSQFNLNYEIRSIELQVVINGANNVKRAQFKDVKIETLTGSAINGDQVHNTELYDLLDGSGILSTVVVVYPFKDREVSFSISMYGSILLYSTITYEECIELVDELMAL